MRNFGRPIIRAWHNGQYDALTTLKQQHQPLPTPTGLEPYHLSLDAVLSASFIEAITTSNHMKFHVTGDTGGINNPLFQQHVISAMMQDSLSYFFYHLGDVVYYYGQDVEYYPQFYDPYSSYSNPIFAIPGNHDGDVISKNTASLTAFVENFCSTHAHISPESGDSMRTTMTQPNVYWTLLTPFATIIGIYSNVPEGGWVGETQKLWLQQELKNAPKDKSLIVSMHHPIYSMDTFHSGSKTMGSVLDQAMIASDRCPDLVLAGHVHNYQRFTSIHKNGKVIPYIIAGAGGYPNLHKMLTPGGKSIVTPYVVAPGVTLINYCSKSHGYLLLDVTPTTLSGTYIAVSDTNGVSTQVDSFSLNYITNILS